MEISEIQISYTNPLLERVKVKESVDAYRVLFAGWDKNLLELQEEFKVLFLNRANEILGIHSLSKGGTASTIVDSKLLFSVALKCNAAGIILAHNHPSGNIKPSQSDISLTSKIKEGASILGISLLDHIIVTKEKYFSFANDSLL